MAVIARMINGTLTGAGIVAISASISTFVHAEPSSAPRCRRGAPQCPIVLSLAENAAPLVVCGRLSALTSSYSYQFSTTDGHRLAWIYAGPAANVLLRDPDGEVEGPGLPSDVPLEKNGTYIFSISSNKMAENIFGRFELQFRLIRNIEGRSPKSPP